MNDKEKLRKNALQKRMLMQKEILAQKSKRIVEKIINSSDFFAAEHVALYFPIKNEADITEILKFEEKKFYFPKCCGAKLEFCKYSKDSKFIEGKFKTKEIDSCAIDFSVLDLIYIPALMANSRKFRLGYGKGYYDRFFRENNVKAKKIIVVFDEFISDEFVEESFDFQCDYLISS